MGTTKFSARLKLARAKAGMTQDELAKKAEMTQSKISTYESEKNDSTPGLYAAAALAMALGVSLDWLAGISDDEKTDIEISGRDFLRKLIDLLLHDGASWEDKALNEIVGDGIYIHFGGSSLNGLDCEISKLFALKKALKDTNIAEDFASKAMDSVISDVVEKYGDYFEVLPF